MQLSGKGWSSHNERGAELLGWCVDGRSTGAQVGSEHEVTRGNLASFRSPTAGFLRIYPSNFYGVFGNCQENVDKEMLRLSLPAPVPPEKSIRPRRYCFQNNQKSYSPPHLETNRVIVRGCRGPASFGGKGMSRWPFLLKHLSYSPVNPFDSFRTWRESGDPIFSNSLDHYTLTITSSCL